MAVDFEIPSKRMLIDCGCGVKITFSKEDVSLYVFGVGRITMPKRLASVTCPVCKSHKAIDGAKEYKDGANY